MDERWIVEEEKKAEHSEQKCVVFLTTTTVSKDLFLLGNLTRQNPLYLRMKILLDMTFVGFGGEFIL